ncbi:MAG: type II toxin-antitoxin system RelE/ParE family toxin [Rhizobiaceae bacterium]
MIRSFRNKETESLFRLMPDRKFAAIERIALRKLVQPDLAASFSDLRSPPGNRLEALKGDRVGAWRIRVNDQYRICFRWTEDGPEDVEIVAYHWRTRP